jgi:hypothetical protein
MSAVIIRYNGNGLASFKPIRGLGFHDLPRQLMTQDARVFKKRLGAFIGMKVGAANPDPFYFDN